jgi:hypothetical protein
MKWIALSDQVQQALGLSDTAKPRLLRQVNLLRQDIAAETDWQFLRRKMAAEAYAAGTPIDLAEGTLGVRLVRSTAGTIYYHAEEGLVPSNLGLRFWSRVWAAAAGPYAAAIQLWDTDGTEMAADTVDIRYWIKPTDLDAATILTEEIEYPGTAALVSGLTGRWHRYEERDPEKAIEPESAYQIELSAMVARNPKAMSIAPVVRGGLVLTPTDRP